MKQLRELVIWVAILEGLVAPAFGGRLSQVDDVRVAPLLETAWEQPIVDGYYVGCVATAGAQVMRYLEWPKGPIAAFENEHCAIEGKPRTLTATGGSYDWTVPGDVTRLMHDLGVACGMNYTKAGGETGSYMLIPGWTTYFGFESVTAFTLDGDLPFESVKRAIISNLDAKLPVVVGLSGTGGGHAVVCDGYGYSGGSLYFHFNMGWAGKSDGWYDSPRFSAGGYDFSGFGTIVYNIFPTRSAAHTIVSGRVLTTTGKPLAGARVKSVDFWGAELETTTDEHGIYALILPSTWVYPLPYELQAEKNGRTSEALSLKVKMNISPVVNVDGTYRADTAPAPSVANLIDRNLLIAMPDEEREDPPSPPEDPTDTKAGDDFQNPIILTGEQGLHYLAETATLTIEKDEPHHTARKPYYLSEARSAWYQWTAPGDGTMKFKVFSRQKSAGGTTEYFHAMIAAYQGDRLLTARQVAIFDTFDDGDLSTSLQLNVTVGETYRLVVFAYGDDPGAGPYSLSWEGSLDHTTANRLAANGVNTHWECFVIGLDPASASARFVTTLEFVDGRPKIGWSPNLGDARRYRIFGSTDLKSWREIAVEDNSPYRFFKVAVELK